MNNRKFLKNINNDLSCSRCGNCCHVDMIAFAADSDIARWKKQNRSDILSHVAGDYYVWAGDTLVSATGRVLSSCAFLSRDGELFCCDIYETRPSVCKDYVPGSSALCTLFKNPLLK